MPIARLIITEAAIRMCNAFARVAVEEGRNLGAVVTQHALKPRVVGDELHDVQHDRGNDPARDVFRAGHIQANGD